MENQSTPLDKVMKISVILAVLVFSFSIAYYFVIFLPQKEKLALEQQKQLQESKDKKEQQAKDDAAAQVAEAKDNLSTCLSDAQDSNSDEWNSSCKTQGLKNGCELDLDLANSINKDLKDSQDVCFKQYPQK